MSVEFVVRINILLYSWNKYDTLFQVQKESCSAEPELQEVCSNRKELDLYKLGLTAERDEPYDTEDLNAVPEGYR
jgi:hypothetical protein